MDLTKYTAQRAGEIKKSNIPDGAIFRSNIKTIIFGDNFAKILIDNKYVYAYLARKDASLFIVFSCERLNPYSVRIDNSNGNIKVPLDIGKYYGSISRYVQFQLEEEDLNVASYKIIVYD